MRALLNLADGATAAGDAFAASHAGSGEGAHAAATTSAAGFMTAADKAKLNAATAGGPGVGRHPDVARLGPGDDG